MIGPGIHSIASRSRAGRRSPGGIIVAPFWEDSFEDYTVGVALSGVKGDASERNFEYQHIARTTVSDAIARTGSKSLCYAYNAVNVPDYHSWAEQRFHYDAIDAVGGYIAMEWWVYFPDGTESPSVGPWSNTATRIIPKAVSGNGSL